MKTRVTQALAVLFAIVMLVSALPLSGVCLMAAAADYSVGDIITLGSYPQSQVTDSATLSALNAQTLNWVSYGYYSSRETLFYYTTEQSDYMKYADVNLSGSKYRAVQFTSYRPKRTSDASSADNSFQDDNGYNTGTVYWFKYEPLQWRVLDPTAGLVVSEYGIDSQAYCNVASALGDVFYNSTGAYANDYVTSAIRAWLNADFYNTALSTSEQAGLYARTLDNSATDKVFLLSYNEVINTSYGFNAGEADLDPARKVQSTDYAKCQGAYVDTEYSTPGGGDSSGWWLRSPGGYSLSAYSVWVDGRIITDYVDSADISVRPALLLKPESGNPEPDNPGEDNSFIGKIKSLFRRIIAWFKGLFGV